VLENSGIAIVADISNKRLKELQNDVGSYQSKLDYKTLEITAIDSIHSLIEYVDGKYGRIDAFVNSAYPQTKSLGGLFEELTYEYFCKSLNIHLGGYFLCTQQFALFFKKQGFGNIINISSVQGVVMPKFDTYEGIFVNGTLMTSELDYTCNKTAIVAMTKYLAKYYKATNIRFNCISPGGILDKQPEEFLKRYRSKCINKGMLDADDLKTSLVFLLANGSKYINGQNVVVDDGFTL